MLFLTNTFFDIVCYISVCARAHLPRISRALVAYTFVVLSF